MDEIRQQIEELLKKATKLPEIILEVPPKPEMGDFAFPCFPLAKAFKKAPPEIAFDLNEKIKDKLDSTITTKVLGPYLNFFVDQSLIAEDIIKAIQKQKDKYGLSKAGKDTILIESPGPNTNKPLHLGHLRNILLGDSISKILKTQGNKVHIVNVVNDRGVHICKSMLAYMKFGEGQTPEKAKRKSDHFVGDYYVKYSQAEKENPKIENEVQDLLLKWEKGDKEVIKLWKQMNKWAVSGFAQTYKRLNFKIEKEYYESDTYKGGKDIILNGLKKGIFEKNDEDAVIINLEKKKLGTKVLLRSNGTSVYITQDINMANLRSKDFKFNQMIYVVGNEQEYHFKVLFEVFRALGWKFGNNCYHFSYGMVELPEGKMKSREGNVVDTDDLMDQVINLAEEEVKKRYDSLDNKEIRKRAEIIAMSAIRFFFLKFDPVRNFIFNPKESLAFEGDTGPYIQYVYARICSIFRKLGKDIDLTKIDYSLLDTPVDKKVLVMLNNYPNMLADAAKLHKPSLVCHYLFDLASMFNEYYNQNPVLKADENTRNARLALIDNVRTVIKSGLSLLGIDVLEQM